MKINLGAGDTRFDGFVNCDYDARTGAEHIFDMEKDKFPFEDNTVEQVIAHHVFEHMGEGYFHCLQEVYRVCKHGTIIDVRVPHPRHDTFLIDPSHRRPIYPHTLDMFSKTRNKRDMDAGGCETPIGFINEVDIYVLEHWPILDDYWKPQFQQMSEEQCEHAARTFNNVIIEYHIKWMVNKENQIDR